MIQNDNTENFYVNPLDNHPKVTVLMPLYNQEKYVKYAMDSILNQTFTDFEFIIINDGSTDSSRNIILQYKDSRVIFIENDVNIGVTKTLNKGIDMARGKYIVRSDADDISLPERLQKQVKFMDEHSDVGVCGTSVIHIDEFSKYISKTIMYPLDYEELKCHLMFAPSIVHPSVIMRKSFLDKFNLYYNPELKYAQDYDMWLRCSSYFALRNLPEPLLLCRIHKANITNMHSNVQTAIANNIRENFLRKLDINPTHREIKIHNKISSQSFLQNPCFVDDCEKWLIKLIKIKKQEYFSQNVLEKVLGEKWYIICALSSEFGFWTYKTFWKSELSQYAQLNMYSKIKFFIKCLIKHRYLKEKEKNSSV